MRYLPVLLAVPALSTAQQVPLVDKLKGWFNQATASLSSAIPNAPSSIAIPNPVASGAAKIAELKVTQLHVDNYKSVLQPGAATASPGIEEWMVFVTGGNKTCFGLCSRAETAWNESVALISAAPHPPNLGLLNCETDGPLCNAWGFMPPVVLHMQLPQPFPDQSTPPSSVRSIGVNRTTITAPAIAAIHLQEKYKETEPYESIFHPFDGFLAKNNLSIPVGYVLWGFSQVPSWVFMIGVSFISRNFMSRRMGQQTGGTAAQARGEAGGRPAAT